MTKKTTIIHRTARCIDRTFPFVFPILIPALAVTYISPIPKAITFALWVLFFIVAGVRFVSYMKRKDRWDRFTDSFKRRGLPDSSPVWQQYASARTIVVLSYFVFLALLIARVLPGYLLFNLLAVTTLAWMATLVRKHRKLQKIIVVLFPILVFFFIAVRAQYTIEINYAIIISTLSGFVYFIRLLFTRRIMETIRSIGRFLFDRWVTARCIYFFVITLAIIIPPVSPALWWTGLALFIISGLYGILSGNRRAPAAIAREVCTYALMTFLTVSGASAYIIIARSTITSIAAIHVDDCVAYFDSKRSFDVIKDGDTFLVNGKDGILSYNSRTCAKKQFFPDRFFNRIACDTDRDILATADYRTRRMFIYDYRNNTILKTRDIPIKNAVDAIISSGDFYLLDERGSVFRIDGKTLKVQQLKLAIPDYSHYYSIAINEKTGKLYIASHTNGTVMKFDLKTSRLEKKTHRNWTYTYKILVNESRDTLLVAEPTRSRIAEYNGKTLELLRYLQSAYGVRDMQFDDDRQIRYIHCANYFSSTYTLIDYRSGKIVRKIPTGHSNVKGVYYDQATGNSYLASDSGVFIIEKKPRHPDKSGRDHSTN